MASVWKLPSGYCIIFYANIQKNKHANSMLKMTVLPCYVTFGAVSYIYMPAKLSLLPTYFL